MTNYEQVQQQGGGIRAIKKFLDAQRQDDNKPSLDLRDLGMLAFIARTGLETGEKALNGATNLIPGKKSVEE